MAGYDCKFVDQVGREYKCKKCSLVAKKATLTDCCGETFCESCIAGTVDHKEPCPHCGQKQFQYIDQVKYQQHICSLEVLCSVKERGCEWTGRLDQLATHLDPDQNNCQFVDTSCPLCCGTVVPRKKLEEHVTKECVKREHFCQYCSFKASFEEIEGQHIPVCKYVPLQCPNRCGVTFEREDMEDHMKMCLKQEISCEFSSAGCEDRFNREDQEKHNKDNIQKHLSMLSHTQKSYKEAMEKNQDKELVNFTKVVEMKSNELRAQEEMLLAQKEDLKFLKKNLEDAQRNSKAQKEKLQELLKILKITFVLSSVIVAIIVFQIFSHGHPSLVNRSVLLETRMQQKWHTLNESCRSNQNKIYSVEYNLHKLYNRTRNFSTLTRNFFTLTRNFSTFKNGFVMRNFNAKRLAGGEWTSPAMYTHVGGYKFVFHLRANGTYFHPLGVCLRYEVIAGEFDDNLQWPVTVFLLTYLPEVSGDAEGLVSKSTVWERPRTGRSVKTIWSGRSCGSGEATYFICHSEVERFLAQDNLNFIVSAWVL